MQNVYEGMFILDSNQYSRDPEGVSGRLAQMIQGAGGEILISRLWEERRLAYPIKGQRKGTYWLAYFRLESGRLSEIRRQYQLNESILRALLLKIDPRLVDALVAHAQTAQPSSASEPEAKPERGAPVAVVVDALADEEEVGVAVADLDEEEE